LPAGRPLEALSQRLLESNDIRGGGYKDLGGWHWPGESKKNGKTT
jgi:hypothetical protein